MELFFRRNCTGRFLISHSKLPCYCIYSICMLKCLFMVIRCVTPRLILFVSLYCMGGWCPGPLKPSCLFLKFCTQYTWLCNIEYCWKMLISILYNTKSRQQCMRWHPWQNSVNANRLNHPLLQSSVGWVTRTVNPAAQHFLFDPLASLQIATVCYLKPT